MERTWVDLLPWIDRASAAEESAIAGLVEKGWLPDALAGALLVSPRDVEPILEALVELIQRPPRSLLTFGELVAGLPRDQPVLAMQLSVRSMNVLARHGVDTFGDLALLTHDALLDWRNAGAKTVTEIEAGLLRMALVTRPVGLNTEGARMPARDTKPAAVAFAEVARLQDRVVELQRVAHSTEQLVELVAWGAMFRPSLDWLQLLEEETQLPKLLASVRGELKESLQARVHQAMLPSVASQLGVWLSSLAERERVLILKRLVAVEPMTLDALGREWNLTRERVRQIEGEAMRDVSVQWQGQLAGALEELLLQLPAVSRRDMLEARHLWMGEVVGETGSSVLWFLSCFTGEIRIEGPWVTKGSVATLQVATRTMLGDPAVDVVESAFVEASLDRLDVDPDVRDMWLEACGYREFAGSWLRWRGSMSDKSVAVLGAVDHPMSAEELLSVVAPDQSLRGLRNQLLADGRIKRTDRGSFGLVEWPQREYTNIRDLIAVALDAEGGAIPLETLVEDVSGNFDVAPNSVRAYCNAPPFAVRDGIVRRATDARTTSRDISTNRRCYRQGDRWAVRVLVSAEHLRGSGSPVPLAVADYVGCRPGGSVSFASTHGPVAIYWTGMQPALTSIREILQRLDAEAGDFLFLGLGRDDIQLTLVRGSDVAAASGLPKAALMTGLVVADDAQAVDALTSALGGSDRTPSVVALRDVYRLRGDRDIADVISAAL